MAYQLKNKINTDFGVNLSYLNGYMTLASLSKNIIEKLHCFDAATHTLSSEKEQVFPKAGGSILPVLNQLTDTEVDSILVSLLSKSNQ